MKQPNSCELWNMPQVLAGSGPADQLSNLPAAEAASAPASGSTAIVALWLAFLASSYLSIQVHMAVMGLGIILLYHDVHSTN